MSGRGCDRFLKYFFVCFEFLVLYLKLSFCGNEIFILEDSYLRLYLGKKCFNVEKVNEVRFMLSLVYFLRDGCCILMVIF